MHNLQDLAISTDAFLQVLKAARTLGPSTLAGAQSALCRVEQSGVMRQLVKARLPILDDHLQVVCMDCAPCPCAFVPGCGMQFSSCNCSESSNESLKEGRKEDLLIPGSQQG